MQVLMVLFLLTIFSGTCLAQEAEVNKRDKSQQELTAGQQSESKQDRQITKKIRWAIIKDKSLSIKAHNVKIITVGGMVTLKGPVKSEDEKKQSKIRLPR